MQGQPPRRLALLLEYEGTAYGGSQYQKNARTIQDSLERALSSLTSEPIRVALAGRTDAGVHAKGQVASFATGSRHAVSTFVQALNALLPGDIAVRAAAEVPLAFDPRRYARSRWYRYTLHLGPTRPALLRNFVWHIGRPLDLDAMSRAAAALAGEHDFAAFTRPSEAARRPARRSVTVARLSPRRDLVLFDIEANAFLMQMVRRITAALVAVGTGRLSPEQLEALVREARPGAAAHTAPPGGLCLIKVRYESGLFDDEKNENL